MKTLAIIPARGGSKRIPRKNIKEFCGKPIIAYSIEAAIKSDLFDKVMVSTDDDEIAEIAIKYGAEVPFFRSEKNSDDFTGPGDVVLEVLNQYKENGENFDFVCCIFATAPLVSSKRLSEGLNLLRENDFDATFPVAEYASPILRSFTMTESCQLNRTFPQYEKSRSQDLPSSFHDAGQFYWFKTTQFFTLENKNVFGLKLGAVKLGHMEVHDIDLIEDWEIAELKYEYNKRKETP